MSLSRPVVLIEPGAQHFGGHWQTNLVALAGAARRSGRAVSVICPGEMPESVQRGLGDAGVAIIPAGTGWATAKRATVGRSAALTRVSAAAARTLGLNRFELTALRVVESKYSPGEALVVILTANCGATGTTCLLSRVPHLRIVHTVEPRRMAVPAPRRAALRGRTIVICPTAPVAAAFSTLYPGLRVEIAPFAAAEPGDYLSNLERAEARRVMGIEADAFVVAMLGGWWPWKDNETVVTALARMRRPVVLLCGGTPCDLDALRALGRHDHADVRMLGERLTDFEMRRSYAASSVTIVSRRRGVATESGLVMDAARYGVPLICSDHDPDLLRRLAGLTWARTYAAGDSGSLAAALDNAAANPPAQPDRDTARAMGLRDGAGLLDLYDSLADGLQSPAGQPK